MSFPTMGFEANLERIWRTYRILNSALFRVFIEGSGGKFVAIGLCAVFNQSKYTWKLVYEDYTSASKLICLMFLLYPLAHFCHHVSSVDIRSL